MMPKSQKPSAIPRPFLSLISLPLPPCMHNLLTLFHLSVGSKGTFLRNTLEEVRRQPESQLTPSTTWLELSDLGPTTS